MAVTNAEILSRATGVQPFQRGARRASGDPTSTRGDVFVGGFIEGGLSLLAPSTGEYAVTHADMLPSYGAQRADGSPISDREAVNRRDAKFLLNALSRLAIIDTPTIIGALKIAAVVTAATGNPFIGGIAGIGTKIAENFIVHRVSARKSRRV